MIVCIAEKPSVARDIARVIGATQSKQGYMEGNGYQVTWTFGHLCELKMPEDYTPQWKSWSLGSLPLLPPRFGIRLKDDEGVRRQFAVIEKLMSEADSIVNCGDAGQEGELIQRWVMQKARAKCPVQRLWISSMTDEAIKAFRYAAKQEWNQLDDRQDIGSMQMRGRDFRQMAAAYLYNLTGDTEWEDIFAKEPYKVAINNTWIAAAYLTCPQPRHYADIYAAIKAGVKAEAESYNIANMAQRPSRRSANDRRWQVSQNLQLVMLAHYIADKAEKKALEHVMFTEASWSLGRNPGNIVEMTGLGERHITDCYTTGRNDGAPESHPGQTPFNGTETWSPGHNGGDARVLLKYCYPVWNVEGMKVTTTWPRQESFFNQRYFWVNGEFTPRETMRGKMALLGYLYAIR